MSALPGMILSCDAPGCLREVRYAPRVIVPARWTGTPMAPIRIMTTLHCCDQHRAFDLARYLSGAERARIERDGRRLRGPDFRADFDHAMVEYVLTTTPEYRAFAEYVGVQIVREHA